MTFKTVLYWAALATLAVALSFYEGYAYDDTDDVANGVRSGMRVYVDHGTGCQYVSNLLGSMTPRLGEDGLPICGK